MHHELLTQGALFCIGKNGHAESAFRDACPTSSGSRPLDLVQPQKLNCVTYIPMLTIA